MPNSTLPTMVDAQCSRSCRALLQKAYDELSLARNPAGAFHELAGGLKSIRANCSQGQWAECVAICHGHPLRELLHQDPYSRRSHLRPRGYPGDAPLIDYLYSMRIPDKEQAGTTELGRAIFDAAVRTPSAYSVRRRSELAAQAIDAVCARCGTPRILCVACGHLREAALSAAVAQRRFARFVAFDQDADSIALVSELWSAHGIEPCSLPVARLMEAGDRLGTFDLVYALGLYDYLAATSARTLTHRLFRMLAPGGMLLIANFVPGIFEAGYMEAFMRWYLVYRGLDDLTRVCERIPQGEIGSLDVWLDESANIGYLSVVRR